MPEHMSVYFCDRTFSSSRRWFSVRKSSRDRDTLALSMVGLQGTLEHHLLRCTREGIAVNDVDIRCADLDALLEVLKCDTYGTISCVLHAFVPGQTVASRV